MGVGVGAGLVAAAAAAVALRRLLASSPDDNPPDDLQQPQEDAPITPVQLRWTNITCVLSNKAGKNVKFLLRNISGEAKPGRLLAIMGPSGSGKTTLLNVLAGQLPASSGLTLSGDLYINGKPLSTSAHKVAYVRQEDIFFSQLTVRETLLLAAELQLSRFLTNNERKQYVDNLLHRLGLVSCADSRVGDSKTRGISGGEKKRLSIACELIASPSVIFADEPTTGLDAFQAERVMETLQKLAKDGHTVVCSIHQPRGSIYAKFDDLILLAEGSMVYTGPAENHALSYFDELGHRCPQHVNPAEFFADLISIDYTSSESEVSTRRHVNNLVELFAKKRSELHNAGLQIQHSPDDYVLTHVVRPARAPVKKIGWWKQFRLLLKRAWMQTSRDGPTNKVRANMSISSAFIFGSIFWRLGLLQTSIQDRMGLLQMS